MHAYVQQLTAGDTIRLPRDTRPLTLAADPDPIPGTQVLRLTFVEDQALTVTMPAAADVTLIRRSRPGVARVDARASALALMRRARLIHRRAAGR
ncbi:hypothetical protein ACWDTQ_22915 [Streptomyces cellulosae]